MGRRYIPPNNRFAIKHGLTIRELEILRLISQGFCYKHIAEKISISLGVVRNYGKSIKHKTKASNMIHAVAMFVRDEEHNKTDILLFGNKERI